jgi:hypothetical protein
MEVFINGLIWGLWKSTNTTIFIFIGMVNISTPTHFSVRGLALFAGKKTTETYLRFV